VAGVNNDNVYTDKLVVITSGTGRGQRRYTTGYAGQTLQLTVNPTP
jgi:hypothetical protein